MRFPLLNLGSELLKLIRYLYQKKEYIIVFSLIFAILRYYYLKNKHRNDENKKLTS